MMLNMNSCLILEAAEIIQILQKLVLIISGNSEIVSQLFKTGTRLVAGSDSIYHLIRYITDITE